MSAPPLLGWGDGPAGSLTRLRVCHWQADSDADRGVDTKAFRSGRLPPILCVGVMKSTKSKILRALPPRNWQGLSMVIEFRLFRGFQWGGRRISIAPVARFMAALQFALFACAKTGKPSRHFCDLCLRETGNLKGIHNLLFSLLCLDSPLSLLYEM